ENFRCIVYVADPEVAFVIDGEAVRIGEESRAEAPQKLARGVEFKNRRIGVAAADAGGAACGHGVEASMKYPNVAIAMNVDTDHLAQRPPIHCGGKGRPAGHEPIGIG